MAFGEMVFGDAYRITSDYPKAITPLIFSVSVAVGIYLGVPLHELTHRLGDVLGGGRFGPVFVDPMFGGSVYAAIFPSLITDKSSSVLAILGAGSTTPDYTQTGTILDYVHSIALQCGPSIVLTPLGLMVLKDGIKRKNPVETGLGFSFALIPLLDVTDLAGVFVALVQGPSFTFVDAVSGLGLVELAAYLLGGVILAGLFYKGSKKLVGRLDRSRESPLEREVFGD